MGSLSGKLALVTGASRGIGSAIARRLGADGATVAVHYARDDSAALDTAEAIGELGSDAFVIKADFGSEGGVRALFEGLGDRPIDILVNNAGVGTSSFADTTFEEFDHAFAVNVRAPFFVTQRALPLLRDGGRIINISSSVTRVAFPQLAYAMTKGALDALGRSLANQLGRRGITVNTVAPGITETDFNDWLRTSPEARASVAAGTALGRVGQPGDIADVVAFLASGDARWVTGQVVDASGGLWLGPIND